MKTNLFLTALFSLFVTQLAWAQIPQTMSYQGVLTDAQGNAVNGNRTLIFKFYEQAQNGQPIWEETQQVEVANGLFNVILGSGNPLSLPFDKPYWLGITVGQESELTPRIALTSSPYSLNARATILEPQPGQGLTIRDADGNPTHVFNADGGVSHRGKARFTASPDTGIVVIKQSGPAIVAISSEAAGLATNKNNLSYGSVLNGGKDRGAVIEGIAGGDSASRAGVFGKGSQFAPGIIGEGEAGPGGSFRGAIGIRAEGAGLLGPGLAGRFIGHVQVLGEVFAQSLHIGKVDTTSIISIVDTLISFNADGTSFHSGQETFADSVKIKKAIVFPDGSVQTTALTSGDSGWRTDDGAVTTDRNVGIGNTAPQATLDVQGIGTTKALCVATGTTGDNLQLDLSTTGGLELTSIPDNQTVMVVNRDNITATTTASYTVSSPAILLNGKVGVGTTNPLAKVEIVGDGSAPTLIATTGADGTTPALQAITGNGNGAQQMKQMTFGPTGLAVQNLGTSQGVNVEFTPAGYPSFAIKNSDPNFVGRTIYADINGSSAIGLVSFGGRIGAQIATNSTLPTFNATNVNPAGSACNFDGNTQIFGNLSVTGNISKGGGGFRIDHPLDPANKYLNHSFVEAPDRMNVYNGNVVLNSNGEAWVELPVWFEKVNRDFRYQLTAIGAPGPNLHVAEKINGNRFKIAGGVPGMEVSWQVTGIRQDPWANANRLEVEETKSAKERGSYLHPQLYGQPEEAGVQFARNPELRTFYQEAREKLVRIEK